LVGTDKQKIINSIVFTLNNNSVSENKNNPYGKGNAAKLIVEYLLKEHG
jgi:UDP-N-acetylglucosamine 2-epimerase